ncbi:MAG: thiamine pyrophosphate-dependent enzyme [Planctomycetota bacterium]|nr:thiamine pyrophosphate-dependent enzyme [Planctomycetota bacterium]
MKEEDNPLHFEYSTNEKVALEIAFGASLNGHLSTVFFKSVGLNVAADSAVQLPLLNTTGGMVVVLGDDPGANSSQNEQDNRHFARMAYMPVFEPANPKETYEMYLEACKLSRKHSMPVFFRMTTHVCHARELISFGEIPDHDFDNRPRYDVKNGPYMPLTELVFPLKQKAFDKLDKMRKEAESDFLNPVLSPNATGNEPAKYGVIASSIPALSVLENLAESGANVDLLKLGLSYPWPEKKVRKFLEDHEEVLIVEELDPIFEQELKTFAYDNHLQCRLHARTERDELMRELTPPRTWKMLSRAWPDLFEAKPDFETDTHVPPRIPQMCPGCGHRSAFHAFRDAFDENTITVADIGCHTLGFFEPYAMGEVLLCMGHSTATATGLRLFNEQRKVVCFLGDATFFHAGMPGIANAVNQDVDVTLILMENNTTAMTGHQPLPSAPEPDDVRIPIQQCPLKDLASRT